MVADVIACPFCGQAEPVVRHGTNRNGTRRLRCLSCKKTFTPAPKPRKTTPETEARIAQALAERVPITAIARMLRVSVNTVYKVLKKTQQNSQS